MATIIKNLVGVILECDWSKNVCTGFVAVGVKCKLIIESLNAYSNLLSASKINQGVPWLVTRPSLLEDHKDLKTCRLLCIP